MEHRARVRPDARPRGGTRPRGDHLAEVERYRRRAVASAFRDARRRGRRPLATCGRSRPRTARRICGRACAKPISRGASRCPRACGSTPREAARSRRAHLVSMPPCGVAPSRSSRSRFVARHAQWTDDFALFVPTAWAQSLVYAFGAWILLQDGQPAVDRRLVLAAIVAVAVILRLVALATPPNFLVDRLYRYVWDGRVQGAGVNPYLYIPSDPALACRFATRRSTPTSTGSTRRRRSIRLSRSSSSSPITRLGRA